MEQGRIRKKAGRPKGIGPYGETTKPMRIPLSLVDKTMAYLKHKGYLLPVYQSKVQAGFPSPGDDYVEGQLDLNEHIIKNPTATFFVRATGDSMIGAGIHPNDLLVVDRSLEVKSGKIVIAAIEGELTVKRLHKDNGKICLLPENPKFPVLDITHQADVVIWGTVTSVIHYV